MVKNIFKYGSILLAALIMAIVLLSQRGGIHFKHEHSIPTMDKDKIVCTGLIYKVCKVRLTTSIVEPEKYRDLLHLLSELDSNDTIYFYLIGNGGRVDTTVQLINAIQTTKAKTISVIEGSVYSAHAYIAVSTKQILVHEDINLLIHRSSAYGTDYCSKKVGKKDRTQDAHQKCLDFVNSHLKTDESFVYRLFNDILTAEELINVLNGHDVIIPGDWLINRTSRAKLVF